MIRTLPIALYILFVSGMETAESGKLVSAIEEACDLSETKVYCATLEARDLSNRWQPLVQFAFHHCGTSNLEHNFSKINTF